MQTYSRVQEKNRTFQNISRHWCQYNNVEKLIVRKSSGYQNGYVPSNTSYSKFEKFLQILNVRRNC